VYRVVAGEQVQQEIDTLPAVALTAFAELRTVLEVSPWAGEPINDRNPDGAVRTMTFGSHHDGVGRLSDSPRPTQGGSAPDYLVELIWRETGSDTPHRIGRPNETVAYFMYEGVSTPYLVGGPGANSPE
jgi:hypothetical protein